MKRIIVCVFLALMLCGCHPGDSFMSAEPSSTPPIITACPTPTPASHTSYFHSGFPVEDVIIYFNEVVLDAEFVNGGDPERVQKWASPIYYRLHGNVTEEDLRVIESFTSYLNSIYGFPGIYEAEFDYDVNLDIHFTTAERLVELMGDQYYGMDGAVTFWYENDMIYDATICIRSDMDQYLRNSVILEEIYNGLGPVQDTSLRTDSIIYSEFSQPQDLTDMDRLILELLYHPDIVCGMNAAECESVIRTLYY